MTYFMRKVPKGLQRVSLVHGKPDEVGDDSHHLHESASVQSIAASGQDEKDWTEGSQDMSGHGGSIRRKNRLDRVCVTLRIYVYLNIN